MTPGCGPEHLGEWCHLLKGKPGGSVAGMNEELRFRKFELLISHPCGHVVCTYPRLWRELRAIDRNLEAANL